MKKQKIYACFIDFKKAYDSVWREALLVKLLRNGLGGKFYNTIKHIYSNNQSHVKLPYGITDSFHTQIGIKQGDGLSPLLFNLFIDDVLSIFDANCNQPILGDIPVHSLLYADDLVLFSETPEGLQHSLALLDRYCQRWHLNINIRKTKAVTFQNGAAMPKCKFHINDQAIENAKSYVYLGTIITQNGNFMPAID